MGHGIRCRSVLRIKIIDAISKETYIIVNNNLHNKEYNNVIVSDWL